MASKVLIQSFVKRWRTKVDGRKKALAKSPGSQEGYKNDKTGKKAAVLRRKNGDGDTKAEKNHPLQGELSIGEAHDDEAVISKFGENRSEFYAKDRKSNQLQSFHRRNSRKRRTTKRQLDKINGESVDSSGDELTNPTAASKPVVTMAADSKTAKKQSARFIRGRTRDSRDSAYGSKGKIDTTVNHGDGSKTKAIVKATQAESRSEPSRCAKEVESDTDSENDEDELSEAENGSYSVFEAEFNENRVADSTTSHRRVAKQTTEFTRESVRSSQTSFDSAIGSLREKPPTNRESVFTLFTPMENFPVNEQGEVKVGNGLPNRVAEECVYDNSQISSKQDETDMKKNPKEVPQEFLNTTDDETNVGDQRSSREGTETEEDVREEMQTKTDLPTIVVVSRPADEKTPSEPPPNSSGNTNDGLEEENGKIKLQKHLKVKMASFKQSSSRSWQKRKSRGQSLDESSHGSTESLDLVTESSQTNKSDLVDNFTEPQKHATELSGESARIQDSPPEFHSTVAGSKTKDIAEDDVPASSPVAIYVEATTIVDESAYTARKDNVIKDNVANLNNIDSNTCSIPAQKCLVSLDCEEMSIIENTDIAHSLQNPQTIAGLVPERAGSTPRGEELSGALVEQQAIIVKEECSPQSRQEVTKLPAKINSTGSQTVVTFGAEHLNTNRTKSTEASQRHVSKRKRKKRRWQLFLRRTGKRMLFVKDFNRQGKPVKISRCALCQQLRRHGDEYNLLVAFKAREIEYKRKKMFTKRLQRALERCHVTNPSCATNHSSRTCSVGFNSQHINTDVDSLSKILSTNNLNNVLFRYLMAFMIDFDSRLKEVEQCQGQQQ